VFSGGIGENSWAIRERVCAGLEALGLRLDEGRNREMVSGREGEISVEGSPLKAYVIPTNEELLIARDTFRVLADIPRRF
jgi:acetate kinase